MQHTPYPNLTNYAYHDGTWKISPQQPKEHPVDLNIQKKVQEDARDFLDTTGNKPDLNKLKKDLYRKTIKVIHYGFSLFEDSPKTDSTPIVNFMEQLFFGLTTIAEHKDWMRITTEDDKIIYTLHKHNKLIISITDNELFNDLQGWMIEIPKGRIGVVCRKDDYRFKIETDDTVVRDQDFNLITNRQFTTKMSEVFRTVVDYLNH
jgi:hypothetical protein|nr:MAG TPA: hypothetical protein [Herelleviridae sp. ctUqP11]